MADANNCIIELSHGGFVHVDCSFTEVIRRVNQALNPEVGHLVVFDRMEGFEGREARGFTKIALNATQIVGVFPLRSRSARPGDVL